MVKSGNYLAIDTTNRAQTSIAEASTVLIQKDKFIFIYINPPLHLKYNISSYALQLEEDSFHILPDKAICHNAVGSYTYGPPMAVAPINMVRRVVEYALTEIPADKISLGIPNYGYDWPLPYERGVTKARSLGNREAVQIAIGYGVDIEFDEIAQSPYFYYWQYGVQHIVWFEDVRSFNAKFQLIKEFGLHGAGYWQIMTFFRPNWLLADGEFLIQKGMLAGTV